MTKITNLKMDELQPVSKLTRSVTWSCGSISETNIKRRTKRDLSMSDYPRELEITLTGTKAEINIEEDTGEEVREAAIMITYL